MAKAENSPISRAMEVYSRLTFSGKPSIKIEMAGDTTSITIMDGRKPAHKEVWVETQLNCGKNIFKNPL